MTNTISRFYTTTFTVYRQVYVGNKSSLSSIGTFDGHIQQASPEIAEFIGISFSKAFTVWCDESEDVQESDVIEDGATQYIVRAKQNNVAAGDNKHLQLIVQLKEDE